VIVTEVNDAALERAGDSRTTLVEILHCLGYSCLISEHGRLVPYVPSEFSLGNIHNIVSVPRARTRAGTPRRGGTPLIV
jgi:hypothetical protein